MLFIGSKKTLKYLQSLYHRTNIFQHLHADDFLRVFLQNMCDYHNIYMYHFPKFQDHVFLLLAHQHISFSRTSCMFYNICGDVLHRSNVYLEKNENMPLLHSRGK